VGGTLETNDLNNIPPSRVRQHFARNIWPSRSREPGIGDIRLMPIRLNLPGVYHYDNSDYSDGHYVKNEPLTHSAKEANVGAVGDDGMKPVSASFWLKPDWGGLGSNRYFFDVGESSWQNRVGMFYDAANQDVVLRLADNTLEQRAVEIRHRIDPSRLEDEKWYHVAVDVNDSSPGGMSLMVDGRTIGEHTYLTRLAQSVSATGEISDLAVDDAESFPEKGALLVYGEGGTEVFEYDGKSGSSFSVQKRHGRVPLMLSTDEDWAGTPHDEGDLVVLLGYVAPLVTDLATGGSTLASDLGKWHCLRVTFADDYVTIAGISGGSDSDRGGPTGPGSPGFDPGGGSSGGDPSTGGSGGGGGGDPSVGGEPPYSHMIQDPTTGGGGGGGDPTTGGGGAGGDPSTGGDTGGDDSGGGGIDPRIYGISQDRQSFTISLGQSCEAWDANSQDDPMMAFGNQGYALLVSFDSNVETVEGVKVGGWEFVTYRRTGNSMDITRYQETKSDNTAPGPYFCPMHTWGSTDAVFITATALIPLSVEGSGGDADYLDPLEDDDLKDNDIKTAFAQVGDEWFSYVYPDLDSFGGSSTVFVWDEPNAIASVVAMFGNLAQVNAPTSGDDGPAVGPGPDGGDGDDPTPPDGGDPPPDPEPPAPPDPDDPPAPGEDDDGPGDTPPPAPDPDDPPPPVPGEDDTGPGDTPPPAPDPDDPPPPVPGEDDTGPGDTPPPAPDPDDPPPSGGGEDDDGPGDFPPQPEPPLPGEGGEDDTGPGDGGGSGGGEDPPPDGGDGPGDADGDDGDGPSGEIPGGGRDPVNEPAPGAAGDQVPFGEFDIALRLIHRSWTDGGEGVYMRADTEAEDHLAGDDIIPCFLVERNSAGHNDRVTIATADETPEEIRLNHNYWQYGSNWVAATENVAQRYESSQEKMESILAHMLEMRDVVRLLKFPSGELPPKLAANVQFGARYDGSELSQQFHDELYFRDDPNRTPYYLGDGEVMVDPDEDTVYEGIDDVQEDIKIFLAPTSSNPDGLPITGLSEDGGIIRLNDEIITYEELDTASGTLRGVRRGVHGTEADYHSFAEHVGPIESVHVAMLEGALTSTSHEIELNRIEVDGRKLFPKGGGYVRIDDEIIGYTEIRGNSLLMPTDLREADGVDSAIPGGEDSEGGGGIFRGRFGSYATDHPANSMVYFFPARHPDRYRERSVDPQTSAIILTKRVDGAIWKRVSWDERVADLTKIKVLARFDGTPAWDSDNIYSVDQQMVISGNAGDFDKNPKSFLFQFETAHAMNRLGPRLGIQADRIELRFGFQYVEGAFEDIEEGRPDSWKDTPWVKSVRVEYVAPVTVHYTESPK